MFPGLILTFDSTSEDVMKEKPRDSEEILSKNIIVLLFIFGLLLAISMVIVYWMTISGLYPVFTENIEFGSWNSSYLYTSDTFLNPDLNHFGVGLTEAKTLTMLMVTLFFCESFLIFQIRRPNKSLFRSLIEDSNKRMYLIIGFLFALFLMLMYIPGVQVTLAKAGINFMFMYLTGIDWLMCFLISLICIVSFEVVKYISRSYGITY